MNDTLIDKLSRLKMEEASLKRALDKNLTVEMRTRTFNRLKEVLKEKEMVKFKLKVRKEMNDEKSRETI
jgi:hypothetical protein